MKWNVKDIEMYLQSKDYVDTLVIPLMPLSFTTEIKSTVSMGEFISLITAELERQFKGRMILTPVYTYLKRSDSKVEAERINTWVSSLKEEHIKHVMLVTSDSEWRDVENDLDAELLWLPAIPLEHVDAKHKTNMIKDQIEQIMPIFIKKWKS